MSFSLKNFIKGIVLRGVESDLTDNVEGTIFHNKTEKKIKTYLDGSIQYLVTSESPSGGTGANLDLSNITSTNIPAGADLHSLGNFTIGTKDDIESVPGYTGQVILRSGRNLLSGNSGATTISSGKSNTQLSGAVFINTGSIDNFQQNFDNSANANSTGSIQINTGIIRNLTNSNATGTVYLGSGSSDSLAGSGVVTLQSGNIVAGTSTSGTVTIRSGIGLSANSSSGTVSLISGDVTGTGVSGDITIGTGSASSNTNRGDIHLNSKLIYAHQGNAQITTTLNTEFSLSTGQTASIDLQLMTGNVYNIDITGNCNIEFLNGLPGKRFTLVVRNETASNLEISFPAVSQKAGTIIPTVSANTSSIFEFVNSAGIYYCLFCISDVLDSAVAEIVADIPFQTNVGLLDSAYMTHVRVAPDNRIYVGHGSEVNNRILTRYNSDGTIDTVFNSNVNPGLGELNLLGVKSTAEYQSSYVVAGGGFEYSDVTGRNNLIKCDLNGIIDNVFMNNAVDGSKINGVVNSVAIDSSGNIYAAGNFTNYGGQVDRSFLVKFFPNGVLDTAFMNIAVDGGKFNGEIKCIYIQSDNKVLVGGSFTNYAGFAGLNKLVRLNSNGTLDSTFSNNAASSSKFDSYLGMAGTPVVNTIVQVFDDAGASNEKYVIGGHFSYGLTGKKSLVRLDIDGNFDSSFTDNFSVDNGKIVYSIKKTNSFYYMLTNGLSAGLGSFSSLDRFGNPNTIFNSAVSSFSAFDVSKCSLDSTNNAVFVTTTGLGSVLGYQGLVKIKTTY